MNPKTIRSVAKPLVAFMDQGYGNRVIKFYIDNDNQHYTLHVQHSASQNTGINLLLPISGFEITGDPPQQSKNLYARTRDVWW